jgi:AcrR family transcriptional regulator
MPNIVELDTIRQNLTHLTPSEAQLKIIDALARGSTVAAAASFAGISRATFYNWHKSQPAFVDAIREAQADYSRLVRERLNRLSQKALSRIDGLLDDPKTPPAVVLRTALAILERPASAGNHWILPEPAEVETNVRTDSAEPEIAPAKNAESEKLPNEANSSAAAAPAPQPPPSETPAEADSIARNAPCPCGSRLKFKRCCGRNARGVIHPGAQAAG